jgi:hypothetical protein
MFVDIIITTTTTTIVVIFIEIRQWLIPTVFITFNAETLQTYR